MGKLLVEIVLHSLGPLVNSIEFMPDKLEVVSHVGSLNGMVADISLSLSYV